MNVSKLSTQELLRLCLQTQDESLWQEFVHRVQPVIAGVVIKSIRRWVPPTAELVDDLVQNTYVKLFDNNQLALRRFEFRHEHALFGFLKTIASNVVQDHFRGSHSQKRGSGKADDDLDSGGASQAGSSNHSVSTERKILMDEIAKHLEKILAGELNAARDQAIFWLYYRCGLTAKEISGLPGIDLSVKGVESVLLRLTRMIRQKMNISSGKSKPSNRSCSGQAAASGA